MLRKYIGQLEGFGITLPESQEVQEYVKQRMAGIELAAASIPQGSIELHSSGGLAVMWPRNTANFQKKLDAARKVKENFRDTRFDPSLPGWLMPMEALDLVLNLFFDLDLDPRLAELKKSADLDAEADRRILSEEKRALLQALGDLSQPLSDGTVLFEHQRNAVQWAVEQGRVIIAHDMGLGKTKTALIAAKAYQVHEGCAIFVIAPVSLRINWLREAESVGIGIEIFSWAKLPEPLENGNYVLIADEAHYAQGACDGKGTARGRAFLALAEKAKAVFCLTGTPMKNSLPKNLYPLLVACNHEIAKDKKSFERHYCAATLQSIPGRKGGMYWDNTGASHLDELHHKIQNVLQYKRKRDCLDLPKKMRVMREVELSSDAHKLYTMTLQELRDGYEARIQAKIAWAIAGLKAQGAFEEDIHQDEIEEDARAGAALVTLGQLRKAGSVAKVETAIDIAEEIMEQGGQVVLFTIYKDAAKQVSEALKCSALTGEVKSEDRQIMVDRFQNHEDKALVLTHAAGGVGLTLTAAQTVILIDRPWTPGDVEQSEARIDRIGQTSAITSIWLQYSEVDEKVDTLLTKKQERIDLVLTGKRKTLRGVGSIGDIAESLVQDVFSHIR